MIAPTEELSANVVDSSGWIEFIVGGPGIGFFAPVLDDTEQLLIPTITITEVFRWMQREVNEEEALAAAVFMSGRRVVDLDVPLAVAAARFGGAHKLPLADSIIYATARAHAAVLWTQDAHFEGLPEVRYQPKQRGG